MKNRTLLPDIARIAGGLHEAWFARASHGDLRVGRSKLCIRWICQNPILTCAFFSNKRLNPPTSFGLAGFTAKPGVILRTKTPPGFSGAFTRNQGRGSFRSLRGNTLLLAPFIDLLDIWKTATKHKICERCILRLVYIWVPNIFRCSSLFGGNDLIWQADVSYGLKPPTWCSSTTKFVF